MIIALLMIFQIVLAFGAPFGEYAWGGQNRGVLPTKYRVGSAMSVVIYLLLAVIMLDRANVISVFADWMSRPAAWLVFGYLVLGTFMNLISRSRKERFVMTPVAAILALLALFIAIG